MKINIFGDIICIKELMGVSLHTHFHLKYTHIELIKADISRKVLLIFIYNTSSNAIKLLRICQRASTKVFNMQFTLILSPLIHKVTSVPIQPLTLVC